MSLRLVAVGLTLILLAGCKPPAPKAPLLLILGGATMGTTWSLHLSGDGGPAAGDLLQARLQAHLDAREAALSHWRKDSAVSRFNDHPDTGWQAVPEELVQVVEQARFISEQTRGALDITLGPVIDLWGFGGGGAARTALPSEAEIAAALGRCGWAHLSSRAFPPALRKDIPGLRINVAAVTEGFVLDELTALLVREGWRDFLLEVGGEVTARGESPEGGSWRVGIQTPDAAPGDTVQTVPLNDESLATSGRYRHRYEIAGQRFSHILDPRTGRPVQHGLQSVSVIAPTCTLADGYATALLVLGPEEGRVVAEGLKLRVVWIEEE